MKEVWPVFVTQSEGVVSIAVIHGRGGIPITDMYISYIKFICTLTSHTLIFMCRILLRSKCTGAELGSPGDLNELCR